MLSDDDIHRIRTLANAAVRGPWRVVTSRVECSDPARMTIFEADLIGDEDDRSMSVICTEREAWNESFPTLRYIAAASPDVVVELLDEIARLRAELSKSEASATRGWEMSDSLHISVRDMRMEAEAQAARAETAEIERDRLRAENERIKAARLRPETVDVLREILADIGDWDAAIAAMRELNRCYPEEV